MRRMSLIRCNFSPMATCSWRAGRLTSATISVQGCSTYRRGGAGGRGKWEGQVVEVEERVKLVGLEGGQMSGISMLIHGWGWREEQEGGGWKEELMGGAGMWGW